jgi:hypothetical protein
MKINKKILNVGVIFLAALAMLNHITAFGVGSEFWEQNPLKMYPGEERTITLVLQNMAGTEDVNAKGSILEGAEIAKISDPVDKYLVPGGEKTEVGLKIKIPYDVPIGSAYNIQLDFVTIPSEEADVLGFSNSIEKNIPVTVVDKVIQPETEEATKERSSSGIIGLIVGVMALIAIIVVLMAKKKQETTKKFK